MASDRPDFSDKIDQRLVSVAANNAATAFQNAFLINDLPSELRSVQQALRASEQELRETNDELKIKVAERTSELQRSTHELQRSEFHYRVSTEKKTKRSLRVYVPLHLPALPASAPRTQPQQESETYA